MVSVADVLFSISTEKSLSLFKAVVYSKNNNGTINITKLGLTCKQFYSIIEKLTDVGLVERINGKYQITSLGKIVSILRQKLKPQLNIIGNSRRLTQYIYIQRTALKRTSTHYR